MARGIQPKKESQATVQAQAHQPDMPKYEYQKDGNRSFSIGYSESGVEKMVGEPHCKNGMSLKVF
jgi:hypothetical protein